jgi:ADP-ribose pyrophosphatase YjhB (NUDIX family)
MSFVWIDALQRLRAIAQTGLTYGTGAYDLERYEEITSIVDAGLVELLRCPPERVTENYLLTKGYPTPKLDVRTAVFVECQVLLVRETADGKWTLPGGWIDETDSPREAAEREVREESGYLVTVTRLVAIKERSRHAYRPKMLGGCYKLFFLANLVGGAPTTSIETSEVSFFPLDNLPPLSEGRCLPEDVQQAYAAHLDSHVPPIID